MIQVLLPLSCTGVGHGNLGTLTWKSQRLPWCPGLPAVRRSRPRFKAESGLSLEAAAVTRHYLVYTRCSPPNLSVFFVDFFLILCLKCPRSGNFHTNCHFPLSYPVLKGHDHISEWKSDNCCSFVYLLLVTVFDELWFVTCESVQYVFSKAAAVIWRLGSTDFWWNTMRFRETCPALPTTTIHYSSILICFCMNLNEMNNEYLFL